MVLRSLSGLGALFAIAAVATSQEPVRISFGVYSFKRPTDVYKEFQPAIAHLQDRVAVGAGAPVQIDLRVFKTYEECLDAFVAGEVDFVRFGPASYVLAKQSNPQIELLAVEQEDGRKICKGVIVVQKDSPIRTLADLRGRTFAFGDEQSTIGRYLSQAELLEAGIDGQALRSFKYLNRHDLVYSAVQLGDFDAGAIHGGMFERLNEKNGGVLRVVHTFDNVGKPWIARSGLDPTIQRALREALIAMSDADALRALQVSGFMPAADKDYRPVREAMQEARRFAPPGPAPAPPAPAPPAKDR